MQRRRRTVLLLMAGGLGFSLPQIHAAGWRLPSWSGDLHGQLLPLGENGPALAWTFAPSTPAPDVRVLSFSVENPATRLRVAATLAAATGDGSWRIEEGRIDIGSWLPLLAPVLGGDATGLSGTGYVIITGEGRIRGGRPSGSVKISLQDALVRNAAQGWSLEGITLGAEIDVASLPSGAIPVSLAVRTMSTSRFGARNFSMGAVVNGTQDVSVKTLRIEIAGGEVVTDPFTVVLSPPAVRVKLHMTRVGLQDIVALVPTMLSDARGRVDGDLDLSWSKADGVQFRHGTLMVDDIEPAVLRLAPNPGFLSSRVSPRLVFVPGLPEPLARWLSAVNPAYENLTEIELGKIPLQVQSLKVRLTPEGDEYGRSASVEVVARPDQTGGVVDKVVFTINVSGPLSQVLRFGMSDRISFGAH